MSSIFCRIYEFLDGIRDFVYNIGSNAVRAPETEHLLVERMQKTVLDKASNKRVSNQQQAFNIFQIPFEVPS